MHQSQDERNYHIFYCLFAGMTKAEKDKLQLKAPTDYTYLNQSGCIKVPRVDDAGDFEKIKVRRAPATPPGDTHALRRPP